MSQQSNKLSKNLTVQVSMETWKKLKIISIQKDLSLNKLVSELLEKVANSKKGSVEVVDIDS